ncbi:hypothetical protein GCM10027418_06660 [Mariniluteicoccus endophyticus]
MSENSFTPDTGTTDPGVALDQAHVDLSQYDPDTETRALLAPNDSGYDDTEDTRKALAKTAAGDDTKQLQERIRVWYEDGSKSKGINPNRPAALLVFEAKFGHAEPSGVRELMWLVWHMLGRPGPNGTAHRATASEREEDSAFDDWFLSVDELDRYAEPRGKANG